MRDARILYVEADPEARTRVTASLSNLGYGVACATDGPSALGTFAASRPDVVLLGLRLVGMEAVEVCRRVKELASDSFLPVIYLTTESDVAEKVRVLEAGGDDFCVEPMRVAELDARIRVLLRMRARELKIMAQSNRLELIAYRDALTDVGNRRAFDKTLRHSWEALAPRGTLALMVIDIDRFKMVNDAHGHGVGDQVLRSVAGVIAHALRKHDEVFRFGGEEFTVLSPEVDERGALAIGERVRRAVSESLVRVDSVPAGVPITVSIGVAVGPLGSIDTPEKLFLAADAALYEAKSSGRDRVVARPL